MTNWRPEGWVNPYYEELSGEDKAEIAGTYYPLWPRMEMETIDLYKAFEAGADAMWEHFQKTEFSIYRGMASTALSPSQVGKSVLLSEDNIVQSSLGKSQPSTPDLPRLEVPDKEGCYVKPTWVAKLWSFVRKTRT